MTAPARPDARPAPRALMAVALPCAVVSALAVGGAVAAAPSSVRVPLALGASAAAILLCVAVTAAVHAVRGERTTRRLLEAARTEADGLARDRARLADRAREEQEHLRAEAEHERARLLAEFDGERRRLADGFEQERRRLTEDFERESKRLAEGFDQERAGLAEQRAREVARLTEEATRLRARLDQASGERAAAVAATANAAGRMQALATGTLADLRAMEERHSDEDVLADLLHLDHRTAQAGRLADSVAVLTGARSGRRWARPIGMESILRGAMGRIAGYQRVRVHSVSDAAVAGHAAEGVMHALAELLDNAANFSPPTAEVHVYVEEVPAGVIVSVEDSGLVMGEVQLRRAERAVSGESAGLGGLTGTRLGLAVVGRLSAKYGLKVSFRPSARGGTGVLMLVPQDILSGPSATDGPTQAAARSAAPPRTGTLSPTPLPTEALSRETRSAETRSAETRSAEGPSPTHSRTGAPSTEPPAGPPRTPASSTPQSPGTGSASGDLGPEPLPAHESANREDSPGTPADSAGPDTGLPRRRRGRTLAAAERARATARAAEPRATPSAEDAKTRAARFSSFRQAVRAAGPAPEAPRDDAPPADPTAAPPAETAPDHPSHSHAYPEGDTTS
ncbi:signal transduction histidine kinase [Streptomyces sp. DSM 42143]|uniref:sensor histidine kinase n=1 Tax=Streptomyces sp. DSM 42143 TaxID=2817711 RepID=UPI00278BA738|nr:ATP-binding protein [Streptomyces sp. DSM 42143]MDQ0389649.1 signal transduction histidine kinase [Streptomyces sp. DSM 42143]